MAITPGILPDNSFKARESGNTNSAQPVEKKIEKVVTGGVKVKKNGLKKFANSVVAEDINNVKTYVVSDVIIPALKKAISDVITNGIDMLLYGETGHSKKKADKISYTRFYGNNDDRGDRSSRDSRVGYFDNDIVLERESDARSILEQLDEILEQYRQVSVGDLNDLLGVTGSYTDNNWGWESLRTADVIRVRDGWLLKLPKVRPLK